MAGLPSYIVSCRNVMYVNSLNGAVVRSCFALSLCVSARLGPNLGPQPTLALPGVREVAQSQRPRGLLSRRVTSISWAVTFTVSLRTSDLQEARKGHRGSSNPHYRLAR